MQCVTLELDFALLQTASLGNAIQAGFFIGLAIMSYEPL